MHNFKYKKGQLYCEGVKIRDIAEEVGTPVYIYSNNTLVDHYEKIAKAFKAVDPLICFSMKCNSNAAVLRTLIKKGAGIDVVSGGELYRALKAGVKAKKIVYAGVGKTYDEIRDSIKKGILFFNVESEPELKLINIAAGSVKKKVNPVRSKNSKGTSPSNGVNVLIRINPDVDPHTHRYITTGKQENKFGLDIETARGLFLSRELFTNLNIAGIHIHIGSQITKAKPFVNALKKTLRLINELRRDGVDVKWLDMGGGLGIVYDKEKPQTAVNFAKKVIPWLKKTRCKIILEPGRFIAGNAGILATRIVYVKDTKTKKFAIVDAGMNDLVRPSLYGAHHHIVKVDNSLRARFDNNKKVDIVGPICESGDFLAKERNIEGIKENDLLAVMSAGAYGFSMSDNYNSRRRAAEVMVIGRKFYVVRKRETYSDLIRGEVIPGILK